MLIVHESTKNFVENPDGYFLKLEWKPNNWVYSAEKKNLINRIKAFISDFFDNIFGHYKLEFVCSRIAYLEAIPEYTALKQAVNKVIDKYESAKMKRNPGVDFILLDRFDTLKVETRPGVELTREKIVGLVDKAFPNGYQGFTFVDEDGEDPLKRIDIKDKLIEYIEKCCDEGLLAHPDLYMNRWITLRGGTDEYRELEDGALRFFRDHVFTIQKNNKKN